MPEITSNVSFDTVAREIRCKWDGEDKASLTAAQDILIAHAAALKSVAGVKSVQRIVCGGCHDVSATSVRARARFDSPSMPRRAAHQSCTRSPVQDYRGARRSSLWRVGVGCLRAGEDDRQPARGCQGREARRDADVWVLRSTPAR
jgi:hypothetical protein